MKAELLASVALLGLYAPPVFAQATAAQPGWSLVWDAPPNCPSEAAVQAEIRSLLAGSTRNDVSLAVNGDALQVNEGFEVALRFTSKEGPASRVLTGRDCKEVAKAAALVIALAVDPGVKINPNRQSALETAGEPATEQPAPPPPAPAASSKKFEEAAEPPPPAPSKPLPISFEGFIGGAAELGTVPALALGARLGASFGVGPWRATLAGDFFPARIHDADQNTRLRLSVATGSLLAGYAILLGDHAVTPELGVRLGNLAASAQDADAPSSANSLLFGPAAGVRATLRAAGPLGFWLGLHGGAHLERPRLVVENRGVAHQPAALWGAGALGLSLRWP